MERDNSNFPEEVVAALEDLRRIREAIDAAQATHPMRLVARPWLTYAAVVGVVVVAFSVGAQLLLDRGEPVLGFMPSTIVWVLGALLLVIAQVAKLAVIGQASQRAGYNLTEVILATYKPDYLRILIPGVLTIALGSVALAYLGGDAMIVGFAIATFGALVIPLASTIALNELGVVGALMFLLGAIAMFAIPEWPFYTLAATWGVALIVGGLVARTRFPAVPKAAKASLSEG
jgi:hypothetical protein